MNQSNYRGVNITGEGGQYHRNIQKPAITVGTQCYDREDVAIKLQCLELSAHIPSFVDASEYTSMFIDYLEKFQNGCLCDYKMLKEYREKILIRIKKIKAIDILNIKF